MQFNAGFINCHTTTLEAFFSERKRLPPEPRVNGRRIAWKSRVRYLGVVFDIGLSWCTHITYARHKARTAYETTQTRLQQLKSVGPNQTSCLQSRNLTLHYPLGAVCPNSIQKNRTNLYAYPKGCAPYSLVCAEQGNFKVDSASSQLIIIDSTIVSITK